MSSTADVFSFRAGIDVRRGRGIVSELPDVLGNLGSERPLVVTDPGLEAAGVTDAVDDAFAGVDAVHEWFVDVESNPRLETVSAALERYRDGECDSVVGLGGGSSMDVAKAVAAVGDGGSVREYAGIGLVGTVSTPVVAVPTTVGTGSEVTQSFVITDAAAGEKLVVIDDAVCPDRALLDPTLLETLPRPVVAATGVDSVTQAVEAAITGRATPVSRALARSATRILWAAIRPAVERGDPDALARMQVATTMQGIALTNSGLGLVHGLSNTIGGRFDTVHGETNAALLGPVLEYNRPACTEAYAELAVAVGLVDRSTPPDEAATAFVDGVAALLVDVGLDVRLSDLGVEESALDDVAAAAVDHVDSNANPREYAVDDLEAILQEAY